MAKRGEKRPWRLRTTWSGREIEMIRPFTETFTTEEQALSARVQRMCVDNIRGDGNSLFEITHRENPEYTPPPAPRCSHCGAWGTEPHPRGITGHVCRDHWEELWDVTPESLY